MARPISKIAPDWWDYTTLDDELLSDAASLTVDDMVTHSLDRFQIVMYDGGAAAAIACGAIIPIAYLILEQSPDTRNIAHGIGPYWSGIATYACTGMAVVLGSLPQAGAYKNSSGSAAV